MRFRDRVHSDQLPPSYYVDTCNDSAPFGRLEGQERAEVCIVGGGFTGVAAALELAERGVSVVLLEQNQIGWGASGRNGGQLLGGYGPDMSNYRRYIKAFGEKNAQAAWDMGLECVDIVRSRAAKYQIDCDLTWGYFDAAANARELADLGQTKILLEARGYTAEQRMLDADETRSVVGSDRFVGGLMNMGWGHCHPLNLVRGEARVAERLGAHICEDARVEAVRYLDEGVELDTGHGKVLADKVIFAGNAYLGQLVPKLAARVLPVGSYILATEPLDESTANNIMPANFAVCDQRRVLDYFRMTPDRRLLFGGMATYSGNHPIDIKSKLRRNMLEIFPELIDAKIDYVWGGYIGIGLNRIPQVGEVKDGVYYAQAYAGHGVAATHMSARLIVEAICGDRSRYDIIAGVKHRVFPGGPLLRRPALAVGMAYYRLLDALKR
jgi:gamma-glutamylputrescine oxidase